MSKAAAAHSRTPFATRVLTDLSDIANAPSPSTTITGKISSALVLLAKAALVTREKAAAHDFTPAREDELWELYFSQVLALGAAPARSLTALRAKASVLIRDFEDNPPATPEETLAQSLARDVMVLADRKER